MKATANQQNDLLSLGNLDNEIKRSKLAIAKLTDGSQFSELRASQLSKASDLIDARNVLDSIELELKRAEEDLNLVEQRLTKDNDRLNQTSSSKDAQGIQNELETLKKRKSDLEDIELAVMDRREAAEAALTEVLASKQGVDDALSKLESEIDAELLKLRSGFDLQLQHRAQQAALIDSELLELYEKKATRGVAIGRLANRECGACRISIGATALAEIQALQSDEIATCPECQAILVR